MYTFFVYYYFLFYYCHFALVFPSDFLSLIFKFYFFLFMTFFFTVEDILGKLGLENLLNKEIASLRAVPDINNTKNLKEDVSNEFMNTSVIKNSGLSNDINKKLDTVLNNIKLSNIEKEKVFISEKKDLTRIKKCIAKQGLLKNERLINENKSAPCSRKRRTDKSVDMTCESPENICKPLNKRKKKCGMNFNDIPSTNNMGLETAIDSLHKEVDFSTQNGSINLNVSGELQDKSYGDETNHLSAKETNACDQLQGLEFSDNSICYESVFNNNKESNFPVLNDDKEIKNDKKVSSQTINKLAKFSFTDMKSKPKHISSPPDSLNGSFSNSNAENNSTKLVNSGSIFSLSKQSDSDDDDDDTYDFNI